MRYFVHSTSNQKVSVEINPNNQLGKGATAVIYKAEFNSEVVAAKIYHPNKKVNELKISAMLSNKPDDIHIEFAGSTYPQIAWPFAALTDENGLAAGYLMPLVDLNDSFSLDYFYDPVLFKKLNAPDEVAFSYKLEIAKNLSTIVAALHKNKHFFIDLKPQNIRVFRQTHIVSLVDCDGFSISDKKAGGNTRFPAELISTDYISPEAFRNKSSPKELGENQDRYALAVILFQLLNNGTHPFQGILKNDDGIATNDEKAAAGLYPHSIQTNPAIKPRPQSIHFLWDDKTRDLFDRAFIGKLDERPSAQEWANHFEKLLLEKSLIRCDKEPLNIAHMRFKGKDCPACYLANLSAFKPKKNKVSSSSQPKNSSTQTVKSLSGFELFWMIAAFLVFVFMLIGIFNKPTSHSDYSSSTANVADPTYPSSEARQVVDEGWVAMDPNNGNHDYKKAYELNLKGYNLGHPEGASNIGMLYENGSGVDKDLMKAITWYEKALTNHNHSAQAEIGLARIYAFEMNNIQKANDYLQAAKGQLYESIWAAHAEEYRGQIAMLEQRISDKKNKFSFKDALHESQNESKDNTSQNRSSLSNSDKKTSNEEFIKSQLSKLSKDEFESITSACTQSTFAGKKSYDQCLISHLKKLNQQMSNLGLDSLTEEQKQKVEINCSEDKFTNGPTAYKKCISAQLKQFQNN